MSGKRSRDKGARGEREWRDFLREHWACPEAERGCQRAGGPDSPDVKQGVPGTHAEVKRTEKLSVYAAIEQAINDAGEDVPYVAHRRNGKPWLIIIQAEDMIEFATQLFLHAAEQA